MKVRAAGLLGLLIAAPLAAQEQPSDDLPTLSDAPPPPETPVVPPTATPGTPVPVAQPTIVVPRDWRGVFDAIDAGNWASARAGIASLPTSVLRPVALAELYTAKGSPTVDLASLQQLIAQAPELPQAGQLALMAIKRGALTPPLIVTPRATVNLGSAPVRYKTRAVAGDPVADQLRPILDPLIKADDAAGAEAQLLIYAPTMSVEGRAEAGQRVAFAYYVLGLDLDARRVADTWRQGAQSEWAAQSAWISGLASWRLGDYNAASRDFQDVTRFAQQRELRAGGYYWAARAEQAAGRPRSVEGLMRYAAASPESFYGLVARETLGMSTALPPEADAGFDPAVEQYPNVQRAAELARIGESARAEEMLRHQAKIGAPSEHHALIHVAKRLDLPAAQLWLANNGQPGARSEAADRYPNPKWSPLNGWRVDPALAFGHIVQESSFRRTAVSGAGAVGLMQVVPATAQMLSRNRGIPYSPGALTDPTYNLEFGQSFLEMMRGNPGTAGQLPRVIASYNAGPLPVGRWATINDKGDPILWIESLPYWETRYYVPSVLRNMWVYQGINDEKTTTLKDIAQHRWPAFPTSMTRLQN